MGVMAGSSSNSLRENEYELMASIDRAGARGWEVAGANRLVCVCVCELYANRLVEPRKYRPCISGLA